MKGSLSPAQLARVAERFKALSEPARRIPLPPNPLTDDQIRAVMAYERTL